MSRPDEGLIHSWLDGELDAAEHARVEALIRDDSDWAAAAAEARGFVAASARITGMLDDVPAGVVSRPRALARGTPWWMLRIAALLAVTTGTIVVVQQLSLDSDIQSAVVIVRVPTPPPVLKSLPPSPVVARPHRVLRDSNIVSDIKGVTAIAPELVAPITSGSLSAVAPPRALAKAAAPALAANESPREECYREIAAATFDATTVNAAKVDATAVLRVVRTGDSTAMIGARLDRPLKKDEVRRLERSPLPSTMRRHGDTLFIEAVNGTTRIAIRIQCPAP